MSFDLKNMDLKGDLRLHEPMSNHTSWKTGGNVDYYYIAADKDDLAKFISGLPNSISITWVGLGSNLLVRDGGLSGAVVSVVGLFSELKKLNETKIYEKKEFDISYRSVSISSDEWFISCKMKLGISKQKIVSERIKNMLRERATQQPLGKLSCGSVFRNPPNQYAAKLIDLCGLKGKRVGGAIISDKHSNFIINTGNATSSDIEKLIEFVQATVYEKHSIKLVPEVRIIGKNFTEVNDAIA